MIRMSKRSAATNDRPAGRPDGSGEFQRDCCRRSASSAAVITALLLLVVGLAAWSSAGSRPSSLTFLPTQPASQLNGLAVFVVAVTNHTRDILDCTFGDTRPGFTRTEQPGPSLHFLTLARLPVQPRSQFQVRLCAETNQIPFQMTVAYRPVPGKVTSGLMALCRSLGLRVPERDFRYTESFLIQ